MKKIISLLLAAVMLLGFSACTRPAVGAVLQSEKPRVTEPAVDQADLAALTGGNATFAFDLYQALRNSPGNLFYSPHSISLALAMAYAGAAGDTASQMADTLRFTLPQARLHPAWDSLDLILASRGQEAEGKDEEGFRLHIVNATWGQKGFPFLNPYLDTLAQYYGAGLRVVDYINAPEQARQDINNWVAEQTEQRIKDLIPQGAIDTLTRLVLTNAIYFNAAWQYPFETSLTKDGTFNRLDGTTVTVPMMKETESLGYFKGNGFQAVELPYDDRELSMVILLPDDFKSFEPSLSAAGVAEALQGLAYKEVALTMPKFEFDSSFGLKDALSAMGMPVAFSDQADFSGMDGRRDLMISDVIHKAFVSVDEAGTEAAAATAVIVGTTSMPAEPIVVALDHPFIFLIRDIQTGAILFVGRVLDPA